MVWLGKIGCLFLTPVISKPIHYLWALVYGFVIPTNKAGNIRPHSVVKQKGRNPLPGSQGLTVWSKLPLLLCKMPGILAVGLRKILPQEQSSQPHVIMSGCFQTTLSSMSECELRWGEPGKASQSTSLFLCCVNSFPALFICPPCKCTTRKCAHTHTQNLALALISTFSPLTPPSPSSESSSDSPRPLLLASVSLISPPPLLWRSSYSPTLKWALTNTEVWLFCALYLTGPKKKKKFSRNKARYPVLTYNLSLPKTWWKFGMHMGYEACVSA